MGKAYTLGIHAHLSKDQHWSFFSAWCILMNLWSGSLVDLEHCFNLFAPNYSSFGAGRDMQQIAGKDMAPRCSKDGLSSSVGYLTRYEYSCLSRRD